MAPEYHVHSLKRAFFNQLQCPCTAFFSRLEDEFDIAFYFIFDFGPFIFSIVSSICFFP